MAYLSMASLPAVPTVGFNYGLDGKGVRPPSVAITHYQKQNISKFWRSKCSTDVPKALPGSTVGFIYGRDGNDVPPPSDAVQLCQKYPISRIWPSNYEDDVLRALADSKLKVIITIENSDLEALCVYENAQKWVRDYIQQWPTIDYEYICVGREALSTLYKDKLLPVMTNIQTAIRELPYPMRNIKVSTTVCKCDIADYKPTNPPSAFNFSEGIKDKVTSILQFLLSNGNPLFVNILPYPVLLDFPIYPELYSFLFTATEPFLTDDIYEYYNVFDSMVDGFYCATQQLQKSDVKLIVAATGWPRYGGPQASVDNAHLYITNLVNHVQLRTPRLPGPLQTYILSLYDEDKKTLSYEKYYGVFDKNGNPFYPFAPP